MKPLLSVLMVAQEPLDIQNIHQILNISEVRLQNGIKQLKNLISENWQRHYSLFHLKFYEYLNQDKRFSAQEWHKKLVRWCKKGELATIWDDTDDVIEQNRRNYVQRYYIKHLFYAQEWHDLFQVLDEGQYGQRKIQRFDPGTKAYILDLDLGRKAATTGRYKDEMAQIKLLPSLWYYSYYAVA